MEEININVAVANNRQPISLVGSHLGGKINKVQVADCWPEFTKAQNDAKASGDLCLSRTPYRFKIYSEDIMNMSIEGGFAGPVIAVNKKPDGTSTVSIPISNGMAQFDNVDTTAVTAAIKGDSSKVFADISKLAAALNANNAIEVKRIEQLINKLEKMKTQIQSTIADNERKAKEYEDQVARSTVSDIKSTPVDGSTVIVGSVETDD